MNIKSFLITTIMLDTFFVIQLQATEGVSAQKTVDYLNKHLANSKDVICLSDNKIMLDSYSEDGKQVFKVDSNYLSQSLEVFGLTEWVIEFVSIVSIKIV